MLKKIVLFILLVAYAQALFAQTADNPDSFTNKVAIASPNAASLGKYGDIPVSYHTGIPDISIPIYTVTDGPLSLPISLSYHASGLKVEENASWVGAGWALNAGGVITRSVRGLPDERGTQSINETYGYFSDYGYSNDVTNNSCKLWTSGSTFTYGGLDYNGFYIINGNIDTEPDIYFFNFNGHSGKFYFRDDRTPVLIPEGDEKITVDYTGEGVTDGYVEGIRGFIITTTDGTKYYFGKNKLTGQSSNDNTNVEVSYSVTPNNLLTSRNSNVYSSWYLYRVQSADGRFTINLSYTPENYGYYLITKTEITPNNAPGYPSSNINPDARQTEYNLRKNLIEGLRLSSITCTNGEVDFIPGTLRKDLSSISYTQSLIYDGTNDQSYTLGAISIKNNNKTEIKRYNFTYDYFIDNSNPIPAGLLSKFNISTNSGLTSDAYRLKLLSLQEVAGNGATNPPYQFQYFSEPVPRHLSFGQDHWGFINGVTTNSYLLPTFSSDGGKTWVTGANRDPVWPAMRAGTLSKITYPTGGSVQFDFEPNTLQVNNATGYVYPQGANAFYPVGSNNAIVGGLRIKTITKNDGISPANITSYDYTTNGTISSGILYGKPIIAELIRNDSYVNSPGSDPNGCVVPSNSPKGIVISAESIRPMDAVQGNNIGYTNVKVSQSGNGYSIYRYYGTSAYAVDHTDIATRIADYSKCDITVPSYPYAPLPYDPLRGQLSYEGQFNEQGNAIKETQYILNANSTDYVNNPITTPGLAYKLPITGNMVSGLATFYQLVTGRQTHKQIIETIHSLDGSPDITETTDLYYDSPYHHQLTHKDVLNSKGDKLSTKYKYPLDFRIVSADQLDNGFNTYLANLSKNLAAKSSLAQSCNSNNSNSCTNDIETFYQVKQMQSRATFVNTLLTNIDAPASYQTELDYQVLTALKFNYYGIIDYNRSIADGNLKPVLDLQLKNIMVPIETTQWKNNTLLGASYTDFENVAYPAYSNYPTKVQKLYALSPLTDFSSATVNSTTITQDKRYEDVGYFTYNNGNIVDAFENYGAHNGYLWGYNNRYPVAKLSNASDQIIITKNLNTSSGKGQDNSNQTINVGYAGDLILSFSPQGYPNGGTFSTSMVISVTGPNGYSKTVTLCNSQPSNGSCPASFVFSNLQPGSYTIANSTSANNFTFNNPSYSLSYTYPSNITTTPVIVPEFYYEGFEESTLTGVVTGTAHTGTKYYSGANYSVTWAPPAGSTRSFVISYWYRNSSGTWVYVPEAAYALTNGKFTLSQTGATGYDEIRICPKDAQMTTYTYDPLIGMTSSTDPKGETTYYEYDPFLRLMNIKDKDGNIIKHIDYHYMNQ